MLILCLLLSTMAASQEYVEASLRTEWHADGRIEATFTTGTVSVVTTAEGSLDVVAAGMTSDAAKAGLPALPRYSTLMVLPRGAGLELHSIETLGATAATALPRNADGTASMVTPWGGASIKDAPTPRAEADMEAYGAKGWYRGGAMAELEHVGTMGGNEVYRLTLRPVEYSPATATLRTTGTVRVALQATKTGVDGTLAALPARYLVVSRPEFREGLQPFVAWKRQEGYVVEEIYADTNQRTVVKSLIESRWEDRDGRWPEYILLVGDVARMQAYVGTTHPEGLNGHITDLYYAEHTGDYLPDALLGRWPVNDTAELRAVVEKTLRYEQCIDLDTSQLRRAILVAGQESSTPAPTTTNGQVNYVGGLVASSQGLMDTVCFRNPASGNQRPDILAEIAQGASFLNYTAHCNTGGWTKPAVGFTSIDTLGCTQPMLYVNNCCQSNAFDGTCFGETLLRKAVGGAIGVIGATNSTLWNEDYYWAVGPKYPFSLMPAADSLHPGAFDRWLGGGIATQGALLAAGNMAVSAFGSPYDKFYWEIYCLLGDPSLRPYLGTPQEQRLWVPDTVSVGATTVRISGMDGATVSAVQGDRLLAVVAVGDQRSTELRFAQPADTLPIIVTTTMAQHRPLTDTIHTALPQGAAMTFRDVTVDDTTVQLTLLNIGTDTVFDIEVYIACDDTTQAVITTARVAVDTLPPRAERPLRLGLRVLRWERRWQGTLEAVSTSGYAECQPLHVGGRLDGIPPTLAFGLCHADSNVAHSLEPSSRYTIHTAVGGLCDSAYVTVSAMPGAEVLSATGPLPQPYTDIATPDSITHLHIEATATHGNYRRSYDLWMVAGNRSDSFEEGLASYPWDTTTLRPWRVDSTVSHTGHRSLRSAPIGGRQTSDVTLAVDLHRADSIAFWVRTSSEQNYDRMTFSIDGVQKMQLSGEAGWRRCVFALEAGSHRLMWRYVKDDSENRGSDCAWIDDVELPAAMWEAPYGWFGSPTPDVAVDATATAPAGLHAAPTPTSGSVWLTAATATTATVCDIAGRTLATVKLAAAGTPTRVDLGNLPGGVYIIHTDTGERVKIIKQ